MAKKQAQPKVEILLDIGLCGERTKDDDLVDYLEDVRETTKQHPDSHCKVLDVDLDDYTVTFYVLYRKLEGVKRVTDKDIERAIKKLREDEEDTPPMSPAEEKRLKKLVGIS